MTKRMGRTPAASAEVVRRINKLRGGARAQLKPDGAVEIRLPGIARPEIIFLEKTTRRPQSDTSINESIGPTELRFRSGDVAFRARAAEGEAREALRVYRELYLQNPSDVAGTWRLAMAAYYVGFRLTPDEDLRKDIYAEGRDAGFAGAKLDTRCAACHFWGALDLALYGNTVGIFKMFFALGDLRDHLNEVVKIDPHYGYGGAYRMLGMIEQKLPGILGGSNDRAREYFDKAIEISPDEPLNYLFLVRLQRDDLDDLTSALLTARRGVAVPTPATDRIEALEAISDLKVFLEQEAARSIARDSPKK